MKKHLDHKRHNLKLGKETIAHLTATELGHVAGGLVKLSGETVCEGCETIIWGTGR